MTVRPFLFTMCDVSFLLYGKSLLTTVNLFLSFISDIICCECSAPNRPLCPRWKMSKSILYSINRTGMFYFVSPEAFNDYNFAKCSQFSETQTISIILWHTFLKSDLQKHWTWKNDSREKGWYSTEKAVIFGLIVWFRPTQKEKLWEPYFFHQSETLGHFHWIRPLLVCCFEA